jgi:hypothetical protein
MFPKQFEQSRNPDEKAFYRHLVNNILPGVLAAHRVSQACCRCGGYAKLTFGYRRKRKFAERKKKRFAIVNDRPGWL